MGRDFRNRGNRGGRGGRQIFHNKNKVDSSWQTDRRLLETDVGITEYISECKGFHGIIKSR